MRQSIYRWFATNNWPGDALLAIGYLVVGVIDAKLGDVYSTLGVLAAFPLFVRRSYPELMLLASIAVEFIILLYAQPLLSSSSVLLVVYAAVVYPARRVWGFLALAAAAVGAVVGPLEWYPATPQLLVVVALLLAVVLIAYVAGDRRRAEREFRASELAALTERTRLLTVERDQRAQFSAAAERTRIARELHDIVAHSLAVIVVQADGGAAAAAKDPSMAAPVLQTIAETSRQALAEMRALVGVLRADPRAVEVGEYLPHPGLAALGRLVEQTRQAGVAVELRLPSPTPTLSPTLDLTAFRIVQEGLTNVLKHAGPAATADIRVNVGGRELVVEVLDDGRGAAALSDGAGNGIEGMRERVAVLGGTLFAGARPGWSASSDRSPELCSGWRSVEERWRSPEWPDAGSR